jgi:two-component system, chemotaxis family, sensor kinase CheA
MSYELDEEILQDFLVEAGEILELLSEQLVDLENNPEDRDLLNAIFRGFHTVKGGAGFLALTELVETCHGAENVFDILRNGQRKVSSGLMDTMLRALDTINEQFQAVQDSEPLSAAEPALLEELHRLSHPESEDEKAEVEAVVAEKNVDEPPVEEPPKERDESASDVASENATSEKSDSLDDISEDEFERLLDELHGTGKAPSTSPEPSSNTSSAPVSAGSSDEITDDEFEKLLDELHGTGKAPSVPSASVTPSSPTPSTSSDDITDDEFEKLLDELHGAGKGPAADDISTTPAKNESSQPTSSSSVSGQDSDIITDDEFEKLLDELHGSGKSPVNAKPDPVVKPEPKAPVAKNTVSKNDKPASAEVPKSVAPAASAAPTKTPPKDVEAKKDVAVKKPQAEATVRVDTSTLDVIMNMVGELVLVRNRLISLGLNSNDEEMSKAVSNLDVVTADLQGAVMKTRMQPIKKVFGRFPRVVRDLARSLDKDIVLEMRGEETDLDKNLVEALADPLIHLVRNSVDHGIEMPDDRMKNGKPRTGKVILSASQEGDHIELCIIDDGAGMEPDKLRSIAVKRGLMDEDAAARLSNKECFNLIFMPGFSSKEKISDISGRGVGMDVVKTAINTLNGSIDIDSELGKGTKISIKVPLTLAILPTLMVGVADHPFALPLASVNEIFHLDLSHTNIVDGQLTIIVREKSIPLFYLQNWLAPHKGKVEPRKGHGHVVIVQLGSQRVGFVVDTLIGQEEVVIKPLDALLQGTPGMAGATITSDGHIALILDVPDLLKKYATASRI